MTEQCTTAPDATTATSVGIRALSSAVRDLSTAAERARRAYAARADIGYADLMALGRLHVEGPQPPKTLAQQLQLTSGAITAMIDRLAGRGLVCRTPNPADRRSVVVELTPEGEAVIAWVYETAEQSLATIVGQIERDVDPRALEIFVQVAGVLSHQLIALLETTPPRFDARR